MWKILITRQAEDTISNIKDRRIQEKIRDRIDSLATDPAKQGKELTGDLSGFRVVRAVGQRYRIVYRLDRNRITVIVIAAGLRKAKDKKDIYETLKRWVRLGILEKK